MRQPSSFVARAKSTVRAAVYPFAFPVRPALARRFSPDDATRLERVERALVQDYFCDFGEGYLATPGGRNDLENHLRFRREVARRRVVPWLDRLRPLAGARLLEIGCGTGSSTLAFAEQGAHVVGLELVERHLEVARTRCATYGATAEFRVSNVVDAARVFAERRFDVVVFYGSLEHMTTEERLSGIATTWNLLEDGGLFCIVDAPNRLWHFDRHTSQLPFYMWLPDDLAYRYATRSPRPLFRDAFGDPELTNMLPFKRWGRGVSYHEIELALDCAITDLEVLESQVMHDHRRNPVLGAAWAASTDGRFERTLASFAPHVHRSFFEPQLSIAIRKHGAARR